MSDHFTPLPVRFTDLVGRPASPDKEMPETNTEHPMPPYGPIMVEVDGVAHVFGHTPAAVAIARPCHRHPLYMLLLPPNHGGHIHGSGLLHKLCCSQRHHSSPPRLPGT